MFKRYALENSSKSEYVLVVEPDATRIVREYETAEPRDEGEPSPCLFAFC